ncbi:MAG: NAD(+) diphosphatase [Acidimicrobiales bacterium]
MSITSSGFTPRVALPEHVALDTASWVVLDERGRVLLDDATLPTGEEAPVPLDGAPHLLGLQGPHPVWVGRARPNSPTDESTADGSPNGETAWFDLRGAHGRLAEPEWVLAGRGAQVLRWADDHRFCGRCGTNTERHPVDRAMQCSSCGLQSFPRLSPATITLVEREHPSEGPQVLLAWGRAFPARFFSTLAGFVEPGESLEECVAREIREEVGVEVGAISYFGSQPWPFPHSLMVGFRARWTGGDIRIQEEEIIEAGWFGPDSLPPVPRGRMSIAGWLLEDWLDRVG